MDLRHQASPLKNVFDVLKDLVTDVNLIFKTNGLHITAFDQEKIVAVTLGLDGLQSYNKRTNEDLYIGINMQHLYKIMRSVTSDHEVLMEISPETVNVIKITIVHPTNGIASVTSLYSLDLPRDSVFVPNVNYECHGTIPTSSLLKTIKDLSHGSKKITFHAKQSSPPHFLTLASKGTLYSYTTAVSICPSEVGLQWNRFEADIISNIYTSKFIEKFLKPSLCKKVDILLSSDGMLRLEYNELSIGKLALTLVPVLEE